MYTVNSALLNAVRALFLAEAGGIACKRKRQTAFGSYGIDKLAYHRMFARSDKIKVLALYLVHHRVHFLKAHNAGNNV